jgi:hypothetical protein
VLNGGTITTRLQAIYIVFPVEHDEPLDPWTADHLLSNALEQGQYGVSYNWVQTCDAVGKRFDVTDYIIARPIATNDRTADDPLEQQSGHLGQPQSIEDTRRGSPCQSGGVTVVEPETVTSATYPTPPVSSTWSDLGALETSVETALIENLGDFLDAPRMDPDDLEELVPFVAISCAVSQCRHTFSRHLWCSTSIAM